MDDDRDEGTLNLFDTLMMPLRLPGRVVSDVDRLTRAVIALQSDAKQHLSSVDDSAAQLVGGLRELHRAVTRIERKVNILEEDRMQALLDATATLQASIDRIDHRVAVLESLEGSMTGLIEGLREDLNARMIAVQGEVHGIKQPMHTMADDVSKIDALLPDPNAGPLTRLKETLSSS